MAASVSEHRPAASLETILGVAREIWRRVCESGVADHDREGNDLLLEELQADFPDFSTSFPIVLRWMVQLRKFNTPALERFLRRHATADVQTKEGFLELQAEYPTQCFAEEGVHRPRSQVAEFRRNFVSRLKEEDEKFARAEKEAKEESEARAARAASARRADLFRILSAARPDAARPDAARPDAARPDAARPDAARPDASTS